MFVGFLVFEPLGPHQVVSELDSRIRLLILSIYYFVLIFYFDFVVSISVLFFGVCSCLGFCSYLGFCVLRVLHLFSKKKINFGLSIL